MVEKTDMKVQEIDLDMSLDDIEELPGFLTPPSGAYQVLQLKHERKEINDSPMMAINFKIVQVLEMTGELDEGEAAPAPDQEFEMLFSLDNKVGLDALKKYLAPIKERASTTSVGQTLAAGDNMQLLLIISRTYNKKKDRNFSRIKKVAVV